jgi:integrase
MAGELNKLRERQVREMGAGVHSDGGNLYLKVTDTGARSWLFRFKWEGRTEYMGLGPTHAVTLTRARELAAQYRGELAEGRNPKQALKADGHTFREAFEALLASISGRWRSPKSPRQWRSTIETYAADLLPMDVRHISVQHVEKVLRPVWHDKQEIARRVRQRIEATLSAAIVRGWRDHPNPAVFKGNLEVLLGNQKPRGTRHFRALDYKDAPEFMYDLRQCPALSARMLELCVLTGSRSQEARLAEWGHFDLDEGLWKKPAEIMKAGKAHLVTLGPAALALVRSVRAMGLPGPYVFPSRMGKGKAHSNMAMLKTLTRLGWRSETTAHGFRSVLNTWATEETDHAQIVVDLALAHEIESKVEKAYRCGQLEDKRLALLTDWEAYLGSYKPPAQG